MNEMLAVLGGVPVRSAPFIVEPMIDGEEERMVFEALREKNFSRYIGSPSVDIEQVLRMTSLEAATIGDYWHFLGGPNVRSFAAEFAEKFNIPFAIPINSATSGLSVALAAAGIGPGDEVIVPAISFTATASAVLLFNSIPVFVDVDPLTFCMDPAEVEKAITPKTRAILPVHLTGNVADMDTLLSIAKRNNLVVIEDVAQAPGAKWGGAYAGTLGDAGVFSFQQSKNIMTGEGGMIVTHNPEVARRCRLILNHGEVIFDSNNEPDDLVNIIGCNFRMPELCAAVGRAQLRKLDYVNAWRTRNADILRSELGELEGITIPPSQRFDGGMAKEVPHLFVALYDKEKMGVPRENFVAALRAEGIPVGTGYLRPMYENPTFTKRIAFGRDGCPWSCKRDGEALSVTPRYTTGMCPTAERLLYDDFLWFYHIAYASTETDMHDIVRAVKKVIANRGVLSEISVEELGILAARGQGRIGTSKK